MFWCILVKLLRFTMFNKIMDKEIYEKITKRKQFSQLRKIDVELAWEHFENKQLSLEEKIKSTRNLLGKSFVMFTSKRFLKDKVFEADWILKRHSSTSERFDHYSEIYSRIFSRLKGNFTVFDLGAGVNAFSVKYLPPKTKYIGVESIGQLSKISKIYFKENKLNNMESYHLSLFELDKIISLIKKNKNNLVFLFKVLDSLEFLKKGYSKFLLKELSPYVDFFVISFAMKSLVKKRDFKVDRRWILDAFPKEFVLLDQFEIANEKYFIFSKK